MDNTKIKISTLWLLAIVMVLATTSSAKSEKKIVNMKNSNTHSIQQEKKDLLAGVAEAVCYSGFRTGQHPDRGEGAKNPSAEEVLEDLQIIQNDMGFKLIRLYDSGVNSEMTLRLIKEHNLDIKVMLGMWLDAE